MPLVIGLMSGTSADGVDAALVRIEGHGRSTRAHLEAFHTHPFPVGMRQTILAASDPRTGTVDVLCWLNVALGEVFAEAALAVAQRAGIPLSAVDLIGSHGQTIYHLPQAVACDGHCVRATLQLGEPCVIAERTGVLTVADFRPRDMAAGGEGAPLTPYGHYLLFGDSQHTRVIHNIGGISNITVLPAGGGLGDIVAFDSGPGNMPIDGIIGHVTGGRETFDQDGQRGRRGRVHDGLVQELLGHPFLARTPPKSTGREAFGTSFVEDLCARAARVGVVGDDLVATVTAFVAAATADAYRRFILPRHPRVHSFLCGGGSHNAALVEHIQRSLPQVAWDTTAALGIAPDALEAVLFAILAHETVWGHPANVPTATGAQRAVVLGKMVPGRQGWSGLPRPQRGADEGLP